MNLNSQQNDRAAGVLVALAAGDALGAGYEFDAPLPDGAEVTMKGGGPFGFDPAEWTDDTSMAIPIADALLDADPTPAALDAVVRAWTAWARDAKDVGSQTSNVIARACLIAGDDGRADPTAGDFTRAASEFHARTGRSGGNGSLMRTAPLALAYLDREPAELMAQAGVLSALTHVEDDAQDACGHPRGRPHRPAGDPHRAAAVAAGPCCPVVGADRSRRALPAAGLHEERMGG